jgi:hypothetical protein
VEMFGARAARPQQKMRVMDPRASSFVTLSPHLPLFTSRPSLPRSLATPTEIQNPSRYRTAAFLKDKKKKSAFVVWINMSLHITSDPERRVVNSTP